MGSVKVFSPTKAFGMSEIVDGFRVLEWARATRDEPNDYQELIVRQVRAPNKAYEALFCLVKAKTYVIRRGTARLTQQVLCERLNRKFIRIEDRERHAAWYAKIYAEQKPAVEAMKRYHQEKGTPRAVNEEGLHSVRSHSGGIDPSKPIPYQLNLPIDNVVWATLAALRVEIKGALDDAKTATKDAIGIAELNITSVNHCFEKLETTLANFDRRLSALELNTLKTHGMVGRVEKEIGVSERAVKEQIVRSESTIVSACKTVSANIVAAIESAEKEIVTARAKVSA